MKRKNVIADFHPAVQRIMVAAARTHPNSGLCVCSQCIAVRIAIEDEIQALLDTEASKEKQP